MSDASMPQVKAKKPNLILRSDTFLGVCEGLGEDFGFNPIWLRVAFSAALLWNPYAIIGTYLGLGVLVAISRFAFPKPVVAETAAPAPVQCALVEDAPTAADVPQADQKRELVAA